MSAFDVRLAMRFEVVLKHVAGTGVTVLALAADEDDAALIARAFEKGYGKGFVSFREVAS
ncbi:MAG: hypothetical protein J0I43_01715 [Microbacterium sp.]|uniref:hypothetical protein n=1 Tax=Microbacterium sp. TaxID=51671 RepID=UPI001AC03F68|nr:hypothetical protein [Microbacterium sp.]MBN9176075.1 hypothetical protein [Microbacterium sp.]